MKFLEKHRRRENIFLRTIKSFIETWIATIKFLNKPLFQIGGRQVLVQDLVIVSVVMVIMAICVGGIYKNQKKVAQEHKVVTRVVEAPPVPSEVWGYIKHFENTSNLLTLNPKPVELPNFAKPYVAVTKEQKEVIDKLRNSLNLPNQTLTQVSNSVSNENTEMVVDPSSIDTTGNKETAQNLNNSRNAANQQQLTNEQESKKVAQSVEETPSVTLTCGPFLNENDASKYISFLKNSPRKQFARANAEVSADNNKLYWLHISGSFNDNDKSWIQRYYSFTCN